MNKYQKKWVAKARRLLADAELKSARFYAAASVLPCSINEARVRPDLAGVKTHEIDRLNAASVDANHLMIEHLINGTTAEGSCLPMSAAFHLTRSSIALGRNVFTS